MHCMINVGEPGQDVIDFAWGLLEGYGVRDPERRFKGAQADVLRELDTLGLYAQAFLDSPAGFPTGDIEIETITDSETGETMVIETEGWQWDPDSHTPHRTEYVRQVTLPFLEGCKQAAVDPDFDIGGLSNDLNQRYFGLFEFSGQSALFFAEQPGDLNEEALVATRALTAHLVEAINSEAVNDPTARGHSSK